MTQLALQVDRVPASAHAQFAVRALQKLSTRAHEAGPDRATSPTADLHLPRIQERPSYSLKLKPKQVGELMSGYAVSHTRLGLLRVSENSLVGPFWLVCFSHTWALGSPGIAEIAAASASQLKHFLGPQEHAGWLVLSPGRSGSPLPAAQRWSFVSAVLGTASSLQRTPILSHKLRGETARVAQRGHSLPYTSVGIVQQASSSAVVAGATQQPSAELARSLRRQIALQLHQHAKHSSGNSPGQIDPSESQPDSQSRPLISVKGQRSDPKTSLSLAREVGDVADAPGHHLRRVPKSGARRLLAVTKTNVYYGLAGAGMMLVLLLLVSSLAYAMRHGFDCRKQATGTGCSQEHSQAESIPYAKAYVPTFIDDATGQPKLPPPGLHLLPARGAFGSLARLYDAPLDGRVYTDQSSWRDDASMGVWAAEESALVSSVPLDSSGMREGGEVSGGVGYFETGVVSSESEGADPNDTLGLRRPVQVLLSNHLHASIKKGSAGSSLASDSKMFAKADSQRSSHDQRNGHAQHARDQAESKLHANRLRPQYEDSRVRTGNTTYFPVQLASSNTMSNAARGWQGVGAGVSSAIFSGDIGYRHSQWPSNSLGNATAGLNLASPDGTPSQAVRLSSAGVPRGQAPRIGSWGLRTDEAAHVTSARSFISAGFMVQQEVGEAGEVVRDHTHEGGQWGGGRHDSQLSIGDSTTGSVGVGAGNGGVGAGQSSAAGGRYHAALAVWAAQGGSHTSKRRPFENSRAYA